METASGGGVRSRHLSSVLGLRPCDFDAKDAFVADAKLTQHRSRVGGGAGGGSRSVGGATVAPADLAAYQDWNGLAVPRAPDFSLRRYEPRPPRRNARESTRCWRFGGSKTPSDRRKKSPERPPLPRNLVPERANSPKFVTTKKMMRPLEAKIKFVAEGQHPKGEYRPPRLFDHRPLPPPSKLGVPPMRFRVDDDEVDFRRRNRDVVFGLHLGSAPKDWLSIAPTHLNATHMARPWKPQPKWDEGQFLAKDDYPRKTCLPQKEFTEEFTRFPRPKSPSGAFLDRVNATIRRRVFVETLAAPQKIPAAARKRWSTLAASLHLATRTPSASSRTLTPPG